MSTKPKEWKVGLGQAVRRRRRELDVTQAELASAIHESKAYIGKLERGTAAFDLDRLVAVAYALDIDKRDLLESMWVKD